MAKALQAFIFPTAWFLVHVQFYILTRVRLDYYSLVTCVEHNYRICSLSLHKREERKLLEDIDQLIDLLHCLEEQEVRLPLKDDILEF